jgi:hypothetical protein
MGADAEKLFGWASVWKDRQVNLNAAAGANILAGAVVVTPNLAVVTGIGIWNATRGGSQMFIEVYDGATEYYFGYKLSAGAYDMLTLNGVYPLPTGYSIRAVFLGCTAGDDIYLTSFGYNMTVP